MTENDRLKAIEHKLDEHGEMLKAINKSMHVMAVQDQKILEMQSNIQALWRKYDDLCAPNGIINQVISWQAGCPRKQLKFLWWAIVGIGVPMAILTLGIGLKLLGG